MRGYEGSRQLAELAFLPHMSARTIAWENDDFWNIALMYLQYALLGAFYIHANNLQTW